MVVVVTTSDVVMNISICTFSTTSLQQYTILHKRLQIYFDKFTPVQSSTCVRLLYGVRACTEIRKTLEALRTRERKKRKVRAVTRISPVEQY